VAQWNVTVQVTNTAAEMETSDPEGQLNVSLDPLALYVFKDGTFQAIASVAGAPPAATETAAGVVELASAAETQTGTDAVRAVHPAGLQAKINALPGSTPASETAAGITEQATEAEVQAGTAGNLFATVARLKAELDRRAQVAYYFDAERITSVQDLGTAGTSTKVIFNQQNTDTGNWYDPTTGLATIPVTGLYRLYTSMKWSTPASPETGSLGYSINGGTPVILNLTRFNAATEITSDFEIELVFTAGQTVEIRANTSLGAINADFNPATRFQMRFIGALA
jgi:hypothetical protein